MHELSIALSILDVVEEQRQQLGSPHVVTIYLKIGPLSGVLPDALRNAYELARAGTPLSDATLRIEDSPIVMLCPVCQAERAVESPQTLCCIECGAAAYDVISGRELEVCGLEIESP